MKRDLAGLSNALAEFAQEREWEKFHSPKNLAIALSVEAAELLEHFQWLTQDESRDLGADQLSAISEEAADVQIYLLMLADKLGIDLIEVAANKIEKNHSRYPANVVRGSAAKPPRSGAE